MELLKQFIVAGIATFGFAKYFNVKLKAPLIAASLAGGLSWMIYNIIYYSHGSKVLGALFGTLTLGILGEFLSRKFKFPATIFITPGIVPLVPGAGMYYTALHFVNGDFQQLLQVGSETIFIAGAIALGILASSLFSKPLSRIRKHNIK